MIIKIQGNRLFKDGIHHWILVSEAVKDWVDIPWTIYTPKFEFLQELIDYLGEKEELIVQCIQLKLDEGIELKHLGEIPVERLDLIPEE